MIAYLKDRIDIRRAGRHASGAAFYSHIRIIYNIIAAMDYR